MTRSQFLPVLAALAPLLTATGGCADDPVAPVPHPSDVRFASVTVGLDHTCALDTGGIAYCWGSNEYGQLGAGDPAENGSFQRVRGNLRFRSLSAGASYTCGVTVAALAYCWGFNEHGELGDGRPASKRSTPVRATSLSFASISAGAYHTCGVTTTGEAYCWGDNEYGPLGDGTTVNRLEPRLVLGGHKWASIEVSHFHTCGRTTVGAVYCWGADDGRLGDGFIDDARVLSPSRVGSEMTFAALGTTHGAHLCGLVAPSSAYCWGFNGAGQLGDGTRTARLGPVPVTGGLQFKEVHGGGEVFSCGLTTEGVAYCWGSNDFGQFGNGSYAWSWSPTRVAHGLTFVSMALGAGQGCGVTPAHEIYCWGENDHGELGNPNASNPSLTPVRVGG